MKINKDIQLAIATLKSMKGKHFSKLSFSYFGDEPVEKLEKMGFLTSINDDNENIILGFGKNETTQPAAKKPYFENKNEIWSLKTFDDLSYHNIDYSNNLIIPFIDVIENGIIIYMVNQSSDSLTGFTLSRDIRRIYFRCDEINMMNDKPKMSRQQVLKEYF